MGKYHDGIVPKESIPEEEDYDYITSILKLSEILEMVEHQKKDDLLWFWPRDRREQMLQDALLDLHNLIEDNIGYIDKEKA